MNLPKLIESISQILAKKMSGPKDNTTQASLRKKLQHLEIVLEPMIKQQSEKHQDAMALIKAHQTQIASVKTRIDNLHQEVNTCEQQLKNEAEKLYQIAPKEAYRYGVIPETNLTR